MQVDCPDGGMLLDAARALIRADTVYAGIRLMCPCALSGARLKLQVDVGMGVSVVPWPKQATLTPILEQPTPELRTYAKERAIAEKLEALLLLEPTSGWQ